MKIYKFSNSLKLSIFNIRLQNLEKKVQTFIIIVTLVFIKLSPYISEEKKERIKCIIFLKHNR